MIPTATRGLVVRLTAGTDSAIYTGWVAASIGSVSPVQSNVIPYMGGDFTIIADQIPSNIFEVRYRIVGTTTLAQAHFNQIKINGVVYRTGAASFSTAVVGGTTREGTWQWTGRAGLANTGVYDAFIS